MSDIRTETEARLRRIARVGEVFIDGDLFKEILIDPELTSCDDYRVDHEKFIAVKQTLFKLKRIEDGDIGVTTWRPYKDQLAIVVPVDCSSERYVCPGVHPIRPSQQEALDGRISVQEDEIDGAPMLFVCAPIRDSLNDVVGVLELFASLDLDRCRANHFNY